MTLTNILIFAFVLTLSSCGGKSGGGSSQNKTKRSPVSEANPQEEKEINEEISVNLYGKYRSYIRPMNTRVYGFINSGKADLVVDTDLSVKIEMDDAPGVTHVQGIYSGKECPRLSADTNKDGYIDLVEAQKVVGRMIIPLDDNLDTTKDLSRKYPIGKSYTFNRKGNLQKLVNEIPASDEGFEDRVIIVQGAYEAANLPATVMSKDGLTRAQSLPIACGKIERISF